MVDLPCEETVHKQESFRTWTVKRVGQTVSTAVGSILQQDVHSSLLVFNKVLYREKEKEENSVKDLAEAFADLSKLLKNA